MELLRDMALFVEVVRTRSFTLAAAKLGMPTSTLSRRISGLERRLGLRLLNRTTRRVEVNEAGASYYARCAPLIEEALLAHEQLADTVAVARGTLRLTCSNDFATLYLPELLVAFTREHPGVGVELDLSPRMADLLGEQVDAALRIGPLADSALIARPIAALRLGLYAAPSYFDVAPAPSHPEALAGHMCIRMGSGEAQSHWRLSRTTQAGQDESHRVAIAGRFVANSVAMVRRLALLGAGIGAIDELMARDDLAHGRLLPVLPGWHLPPIPLTLLTASRLVPARVRLFGDFLARHFAQAHQRASTSGWPAP